MRVFIAGGFERSGHDAVSRAIEEEGEARGHHVVTWRWRDHFPLAEHPLFHLHRIGAERNAPSLAGVLDLADLPSALADDLAGALDLTGFDAVISVHPWSTVIASRAMETAPMSTFFVDITPDFGPFPIFAPSRVDAYVGAGFPRWLPMRVRRKCVRVGVPVRRSFCPSSSDLRERVLVASVGASGWLVDQVAACLPALCTGLQPSGVVVLAPTGESASRWRARLAVLEVEANVIEGLDDIGYILRCATWLVTKASGAAVAEGLAAGCLIMAVESGVFWEDEARAYLAAARIVAPTHPADNTSDIRRQLADGPEWQAACSASRSASTDVWDLLETRPSPKAFPDEEAVVRGLIQSLALDRQMHGLERASDELLQALANWIQE